MEYVRILHLAASTMQSTVETVLEALLAAGKACDFMNVKALAAPESSPVPVVHIAAPDPADYDRLIAGGIR